MTEKNLKDIITEKALHLGFDKIGFANPSHKVDSNNYFDEWIKSNYHGTMKWMESRKEERTNIFNYFPEVKTVISLAFNYFTQRSSEFSQNYNSDIKFSNYAWGDDYHKVIKDKLHLIKDTISDYDSSIKTLVCVDTAPIMEKKWAEKAGIGWQGKNTNLLTKDLGSWIFLAEILIDQEIEYDIPFSEDLCGTCTACIDACPTNALTEYKIDSNKCISYLTIEYREDFKNENLHDWIYGCDICQEVCPWNIKFEQVKKDQQFEPRESLVNFFQSNWNNLSEETFQSSFSNSAVKRTKYKGLKRNIESL